MVHRAVAFWKYKFANELPCHWCGKPLAWDADNKHDRIVVDHLDHNPSNNGADNLVASCVTCNSRRQRGQSATRPIPEKQYRQALSVIRRYEEQQRGVAQAS